VDERKPEAIKAADAAGVRVPVPGSPETDGQAVTAEPRRRRKSLFREYGEAIVIAVLLALVIRTLVVQAFTIPSGSMMDTLLVGDYILVNKFLYGAEMPFTEWRMPGLRDPRRGDIVVFKYPQDEKRDFIKRIVGLPGDRLVIRGSQVIVNGQALEESYVKQAPALGHASATYCPYAYGCDQTRVPPDSYFVMGDNRDNSQDSRYWGFVRRDKIKGKAFLIYWSWDGDRHWLRWWRLGNYIP
jgi:signal peptidase I